MKSWTLSLSLVLAMSYFCKAFVARLSLPSKMTLKMIDNPPSVERIIQTPQLSPLSRQSPLTKGIEDFIGTSQLVSLKERRPPTPEEIQKKKDNFNFWFWGGGFVAPFLATFYYFGLKFWER